MIKPRFASWLVVAAGLMGSMGGLQAATGGAIPVQVNIPDMNQKGWEYRVALSSADSAPAGSHLTELSWRYELTANGVLPEAWLCAPSECVALKMAQGSTAAFKGMPISTPLSLHFVVPGKGMLKRPVQGGVAQIFVNYQR